jgi:hypothetical protein
MDDGKSVAMTTDTDSLSMGVRNAASELDETSIVVTKECASIMKKQKSILDVGELEDPSIVGGKGIGVVSSQPVMVGTVGKGGFLKIHNFEGYSQLEAIGPETQEHIALEMMARDNIFAINDQWFSLLGKDTALPPTEFFRTNWNRGIGKIEMLTGTDLRFARLGEHPGYLEMQIGLKSSIVTDATDFGIHVGDKVYVLVGENGFEFHVLSKSEVNGENTTTDTKFFTFNGDESSKESIIEAPTCLTLDTPKIKITARNIECDALYTSAQVHNIIIDLCNKNKLREPDFPSTDTAPPDA